MILVPAARAALWPQRLLCAGASSCADWVSEPSYGGIHVVPMPIYIFPLADLHPVQSEMAAGWGHSCCVCLCEFVVARPIYTHSVYLYSLFLCMCVLRMCAQPHYCLDLGSWSFLDSLRLSNLIWFSVNRNNKTQVSLFGQKEIFFSMRLRRFLSMDWLVLPGVNICTEVANK